MNTMWDEMLKEIVKEYNESPDNFLRRQTICKTIHPKCSVLSTKYYNEMVENSFFNETILPGMYDNSIGEPLVFKPIPSSSPLTVQHVYHLYLLKEKLDLFIPKEKITHIVEIGGGYGNLCRLIKNFGYNGRYIIVDLPEMLEIQKDYLSRISIKDVEFSTLNMDQLIPKEDTDVSILIATFSINEMPMEVRQGIEPYYKHYDYLFFAYNRSFDGINNVEYFDELRSFLEDDFEIEYFKDIYKTSWFMICKKRDNI